MSDKLQNQDLELALARVEKEWRELAETLVRHVQSSSRVIQAERFLLLDASGKIRGEWRCQDNGAAGLTLSDPQGRMRSWLGVRENGSAYLSLKDEFGRIRFLVPDDGGMKTGERQEPTSPALEPGAGTGGQSQDAEGLAPRLQHVEEELANLKGSLASRSREPDLAQEAEKAVSLEEEGELRFPISSRVLQRLEKVERQNRRLKIAGIAALVLLMLTMAGLGVLWTHPQPPGSRLEAEELVIRGKGGVARARLGGEAGTVRLDLLDQEGKPRAVLALAANGEPSLSLTGRDQEVKARLGEKQGTMRLEWLAQGKPRLTLSLGPEGRPSLVMLDQNQKTRADLALGADDEPGLNFLDQEGNLRVALGNINPLYRDTRGVKLRSLSSLVLFNERGVPFWLRPSWPLP
jgi:hypothetical protein